MALIAGAEAQHSAARAAKGEADLPWPPFARDVPGRIERATYLHPLTIALGASMPVNVYPFYEMASAHAWGQTPAEARARPLIYGRACRIAADNPASWLGREFTAAEIVTPTPDNRLIPWRYTKLMVANPMVNQGAAVILTSLAVARESGIAEDEMIHIWGGGAAHEPRDFLARDGYAATRRRPRCRGGAATWRPRDSPLSSLQLLPGVPKMARRTLGVGEAVAPTVTGGLTFFGAPLNDYMTHAAAAMVRRLRDGRRRGCSTVRANLSPTITRCCCRGRDPIACLIRITRVACPRRLPSRAGAADRVAGGWAGNARNRDHRLPPRR